MELKRGHKIILIIVFFAALFAVKVQMDQRKKAAVLKATELYPVRQVQTPSDVGQTAVTK